MRKVHLQELIQDYLSGGDAPEEIRGKYHDEVVLKHMENAFNAIVFSTWMEAKAHADYSVLDSWARNYTITITSVDGTSGIAILPYPPMQLPDNRGILQLTPDNDLTNPFAYQETNAQGVFAALEVSSVLLKPSFYLEQNASSTDNTDTHQLILSNIPNGVATVYAKLIVPISRVDLYDEIVIPAGKEDMMIRVVIGLMQGKLPEDVINDSLARK